MSSIAGTSTDSARKLQPPTTAQLTIAAVRDFQALLFKDTRLLVAVEDLSNWPLPEYLWAAVFQARALHQGRESHDDGAWKTPAWDFARFAKAHPQLLRLRSGVVLSRIYKVLGRQFWINYLEMELDDAEMAFVDCWQRSHTIPGYDALTVALMEADRSPIPTNESESGPLGYRRFLAVARSLQRQNGSSPILLPCVRLGDLLNCKPMTISRYRAKAIHDGLLVVSKVHERNRTATEFFFLADPTSRER